jgi:hypothetical protein
MHTVDTVCHLARCALQLRAYTVQQFDDAAAGYMHSIDSVLVTDVQQNTVKQCRT